MRGGRRLFWGRAPAPKPRPQKGHGGGVNRAGHAGSRRHEPRDASAWVGAAACVGGDTAVSPIYGALLCSPAIYRRAIALAGTSMRAGRRYGAGGRGMAIYRRAVVLARRIAIYRGVCAVDGRRRLFWGRAPPPNPAPKRVTAEALIAPATPGRDATSRVMQRVAGRGCMCGRRRGRKPHLWGAVM